MQTLLPAMSYKDRNVSSYIDQYSELFAQLEQMGRVAEIPPNHNAGMLLVADDNSFILEPTAAALRATHPLN